MVNQNIVDIINDTLHKHGESIDNDFIFEQFINEPNKQGAFQLENSWFIYETDEKNVARICGPFSENDVIYACAKLLHKSKYFEVYRFSDKAKQTYRHACFRSVQEALDAITNRVNMLSSKQINTNIQKTVLNHVKTPHSVSRPVICKENNNYYLASFIFFFTKEDIEQGRVKRPTMWALFDLVTGDLIEERHTNEIDFSNASYDVTYNIRKNTHHRLSRDYYDKAFDILDSCRRKLIYENKFDEQEYREYLAAIMIDAPDEYKRFYNDLSI